MKYKVIRKQYNNDNCVVCGKVSPFGLQTDFYHVEGDMMVGLVTGRDIHQSYPGRMHGGLITALLDEVIGRAVNIPEPEGFGVTSDINVKFKKPVPLNEPLKVVGKLTRNTRLVFTAKGFIEDRNGSILATGSATYIKMSPEKIMGVPLTAQQWFIVEDDVTEIEIANADWFENN